MAARDRLARFIDELVAGNQSELARRLGEPPTWVNHRVIGRTEIKADELVRIAEALGVDVCEFFPEPTDVGARLRRFERAGAALQGVSVEEFRASGYDISIGKRRSDATTLPEQPGLVDAVEQQLVADMAALPDSERDVARRMGALLIEYRDRILREERGEG